MSTVRFDPIASPIAMNVNAMAGDRERCPEAGKDEYGPKPVSVAAVTEALLRGLDRSSKEE